MADFGGAGWQEHLISQGLDNDQWLCGRFILKQDPMRGEGHWKMYGYVNLEYIKANKFDPVFNFLSEYLNHKCQI